MRTECVNARLPAPIFSTLHGEFKVTLKNGYFVRKHVISEAIVEFCCTPRSRAKIIAFTGKSRTYTMIHLVQLLVDNGLIKLTLPENPKVQNGGM